VQLPAALAGKSPVAVVVHCAWYFRTSRGVQSLSQQLYSPHLEFIGLAAAMRGFCRDFAERQKVDIHFEADKIDRTPAPDVSLCLLRVLQEALHNAAKHSHAPLRREAGIQHERTELASVRQRSRVRSRTRVEIRRHGAEQHVGTRASDKRHDFDRFEAASWNDNPRPCTVGGRNDLEEERPFLMPSAAPPSCPRCHRSDRLNRLSGRGSAW
jgi:hypothetical protein